MLTVVGVVGALTGGVFSAGLILSSLVFQLGLAVIWLDSGWFCCSVGVCGCFWIFSDRTLGFTPSPLA